MANTWDNREVTDEMVKAAYHELQTNPFASMRSAITAALAVKPPPIQVVWATPVEQPNHAPQT